MVATYLSYDLINRNYKTNLERLAKSGAVEREAQYYNDNIGKVKTVDEFVKDYRLFSYAMKAYGLEDMTYATAFMKKVLNSDLTDDNSFANKLTDDRYRKFAAAFQLSSETAVAQTSKQQEDVFAAYQKRIDDEGDSVAAENTYFKTAITSVTSVDSLLNNERLRNYVLDAFKINGPYWSKDHLTKVLTSDLSDPTSYANSLTVSNKADYLAFAAAFNFNASGTLDSGVTAQTAQQTLSTVETYTFTVPDRLVPAGAELNKQYFESRLSALTSVDDLVNDARLLNYVKVSYGLEKIGLKSAIKNILTSDLSDPNNYATTFGGSAYEALAKAFNFNTDGSIKPGGVQTAAQTAETSSLYMARYDDSVEASDDGLYTYYKNYIGTVDSVDELYGTKKLYDFVLVAFGFDPRTARKSDIEKALTSDLADPRSFANKQKDPRYKELAAAFNFDAKGEKSVPDFIQSQSTMQEIAKDYVVFKTKFLTGKEQEAEKKKATEEATYYSEQIQKMETRDELLANRRVINFILTAKGIDPKEVSTDFMKQVLTSDLSDPKSFANHQEDHRFIEIASSFNFDEKGDIAARSSGIQGRAGIMMTDYLYLQQSLEVQTGEDSPGARLALYFKRQLPSINSAYDILGDTALLEVFRTAFQLPSEMSNMDIDKQKAIVDKYLDLKKLQDPGELEKFITRYTAMYDLANQTDVDPIMSLFGRSSTGISADLLWSFSNSRS